MSVNKGYFTCMICQAYTAFGPTLIQPTWFCSRRLYDRVGAFCEDGKVCIRILWDRLEHALLSKLHGYFFFSGHSWRPDVLLQTSAVRWWTVQSGERIIDLQISPRLPILQCQEVLTATRGMVISQTSLPQGNYLEPEGSRSWGTGPAKVEALYHLERWEAGKEVVSVTESREQSQGMPTVLFCVWLWKIFAPYENLTD